MRKNKLIITLVLITVVSLTAVIFSVEDANAENIYVEKVYEDLITYDIWKHSNGDWQFGRNPGSQVDFDYESSVTIDTSMKLVGVNVEHLKVPSEHIWHDMALKNASISGSKYKDGKVTYRVSAVLLANIKPLDIKQYDWQNENVEGYRYYIPVKITVRYEQIKASEGEDEEDIEDEEIGDIPNDNENYYSAEADLIIPEKAYAGHKVLLQDNSHFTDGSNTYTAYQFYKNNLGSSSFRKYSGEGNVTFYKLPKTSSGYYTDRYAVFSQEGEYEIKLTAKVNGGNSSVDTEEISILPVPDLSVTVGGTQKENRKQILNISAALDPESNLKNIWVELSEKDGSHLVHLDHIPGKEGCIDNSSLIKTRPIKVKDSGDHYENVYLEFMTKNDTEKLMKYTVYIEDEAGKSDIETGYFTVYPDEAPEACIDVDKYSVRAEGSNIAEIDIRDSSLTYSDEVERIWKIKDGDSWTESFDYKDNSFGTGKNIIHYKEGVGKAEYMLIVKDVISEEDTLYEYISDSDIEYDEAYGETEVVNIAPVVSINALEKPSADVLMITSEKSSELGKETEERIRMGLAEKGISSNIYYQEMEGNLSDVDGFGNVIETETPFSYNSQWTGYEDNNFIADSRKVYKIGADFGVYGGGEYRDEPMPQEPYIVEAYDIKTGDLLWKKVFYDSTFELGTDFIISQDDSEDNLYITNNRKTMIIDKDQGDILCVLDTSLSGNSFVENDCIYTFSDKGIICTNKSDGIFSVIDETPIYGGAVMLHGKICFTASKNGVLNRGYFDTASRTAEYIPLEGTDGNYIGFDQDIYGNFAAVKKNEGSIVSIKLWDENHVLLKEISAGAYEDDCYIVRDEDGRLSYASFIYNVRKTKSDGTKKYYVLVKIAGIFDDVSMSSSLSSSSDYKTAPDIIYGYCNGDKVIIVTASEYWYVFNYGTSGYSERSYCYEFNTSTGTSKQYRGSGDFSWLKGVNSEYGYLTDSSLVLQLTEGNPVNDGVSGSTSMYTSYGRDAEYMLTKYYNKYLGGNNSSYEGIVIVGENGDIKTESFPSGNAEKIQVFDISNESDISKKSKELIEWISNNNDTSAQNRMIFQKGEKISFSGEYSDYENDPSKASYYLYYHCPFNDGENNAVNHIMDDDSNVLKTYNSQPLTEPIEKFYQDGIYKVEHWQYDDTGNEVYDKKSNVAVMYFYIEGTASAPWIDSIATDPYSPEEGGELDLKISVDDKEKNELSLETKVYMDGEIVKTDITDNIFADVSGRYPVINVPVSEGAVSGRYNVLCKVSDGTASSVKEYSFSIVSDKTIEANVYHTEQWDKNRKKYNLYIFGNECNYISDLKAYILSSKPRKRGINVFWSEEKFLLQADISGEPKNVVCRIKGTEYEAVLNKSYYDEFSDKTVCKGALWDSSMKGRWGSSSPASVTFVFTAYYDGGIERTFETSVIIDDTDTFWRVHKLY